MAMPENGSNRNKMRAKVDWKPKPLHQAICMEPELADSLSRRSTTTSKQTPFPNVFTSPCTSGRNGHVNHRFIHTYQSETASSRAALQWVAHVQDSRCDVQTQPLTSIDMKTGMVPPHHFLVLRQKNLRLPKTCFV